MDCSRGKLSAVGRCIAMLSLFEVALLGCAEGAETGQGTRSIRADSGVDVPSAFVPEIEGLFPSGNPRNGPLLIRGQGFLHLTAVTIGGLEAELDSFSDTEVAVRVPEALPLGPADVYVYTQRARSEPESVEVIGQYPPGPPSPARIVASAPATQFAIPSLSGVRYAGAGEDALYFYEWQLGCRASKAQDDRLRLILGTEHALGYGGIAERMLYGSWDMNTSRITLVVLRKDGNETYSGYLNDVGAAVLSSAETGRQLVLPIGFSCRPCLEESEDECLCPERTERQACRGTELCCSTADYVDRGCVEDLCGVEP